MADSVTLNPDEGQDQQDPSSQLIPCQVCGGQLLNGESEYLEHLRSKRHQDRYFKHIDLETEKPFVKLLDEFLEEINPRAAIEDDADIAD